jgi:hypothetical protein
MMMDGLWRGILQRAHEQKQDYHEGARPTYKGGRRGEVAHEVASTLESQRIESERIWKALEDSARGA